MALSRVHNSAKAADVAKFVLQLVQTPRNTHLAMHSMAVLPTNHNRNSALNLTFRDPHYH